MQGSILKTAEEYLIQGKKCQDAGQVQTAIDYYSKAVALNPNEFSAYHNLGNIFAQLGRSDEAIQCYKQCVHLQPSIPWTYHSLGEALSCKGLWDEAIAAFQQCLQLKPDISWTYHHLGEALNKLGRLDEAIAAYRQCIYLKPDICWTYHSLGEVLSKKGLLDEAIVAYRQCLQLNPNLAFTHGSLASILQRQEQLELAIIHYKKALEIDPNLEHIRDALTYALAVSEIAKGDAYKETDQFEEAVYCYSKAIGYGLKNFSVYYNLGKSLSELGQLNESIVAYRQCIKLEPAVPWTYFNLGDIYSKMGALAEAEDCYRQFIQRQSNCAWAYCNLADVCIKRGNVEQAVDCYQQAIYLQPNFPWSYQGLGEILAQQGKFEEAIQNYCKVIAIKPDSALTYQTLADILARKNQLQDAIANYRTAIQHDPNLYHAHLGLADSLTKQGEIDEAMANYQIAVRKKAEVARLSFVEQHWDDRNPRQPNFIIIGAAKSGTSSLYMYINQHPQVIASVGTTDKEINFFTTEFEKGTDWYLSHFPPLPKGSSFITGEASPSYLTCADNAEERLFSLFPKTKLICILRNPIDRAFSEYKQATRLGLESRSFEEVVTWEIQILQEYETSILTYQDYWETGKTYIGNSLYYLFLDKWIQFFSKEQLLVLESEELDKNPAKVMLEVFSFLNLSNYESTIYPRYNSGGTYAPISKEIRQSIVTFMNTYTQKLEVLLDKKFDWF